jgi:hypothetical protein
MVKHFFFFAPFGLLQGVLLGVLDYSYYIKFGFTYQSSDSPTWNLVRVIFFKPI